ncbi:hypothetical protein DB30_02333 [Enhygromyxa salina]|uniref:Uncharacterized protein n=2 Tax=Enhygromyxa salina TaxID=215803 RepID=A0A0C2CKY1_9BACT|nr:hypothetical protein DB30_02333 [Enhygromyxa salina]
MAAGCGHAMTTSEPVSVASLQAAASKPDAAASFIDAAAPPDSPDEIEVPPVTGQAFCCESASANRTGTGCFAISSELINSCSADGKKVLYCGGSYLLDGNKVTCID